MEWDSGLFVCQVMDNMSGIRNSLSVNVPLPISIVNGKDIRAICSGLKHIFFRRTGVIYANLVLYKPNITFSIDSCDCEVCFYCFVLFAT
jgi:hypothetical protein